jgi:hypothetical protein
VVTFKVLSASTKEALPVFLDDGFHSPTCFFRILMASLACAFDISSGLATS